jgi:hypothetical protein
MKIKFWITIYMKTEWLFIKVTCYHIVFLHFLLKTFRKNNIFFSINVFNLRKISLNELDFRIYQS